MGSVEYTNATIIRHLLHRNNGVRRSQEINAKEKNVARAKYLIIRMKRFQFEHSISFEIKSLNQLSIAMFFMRKI